METLPKTGEFLRTVTEIRRVDGLAKIRAGETVQVLNAWAGEEFIFISVVDIRGKTFFDVASEAFEPVNNEGRNENSR